MEHAASHDGLGDRGQQKVREQIRHACDGCRIRKVRCHLEPKPTELFAQNGTTQITARRGPIQTQSEMKSRMKCLRCTKLGLDCSFDLPVQRRGPKGSGRKSVGSLLDTSTRQDVEPILSRMIRNTDQQVHSSHSMDSTSTSPSGFPFFQTTPQIPSSSEATSDIFCDPAALAFDEHVRGDSMSSLHGGGRAESTRASTIWTPTTPSHASHLAMSERHQYFTDEMCPMELIGRIVDDFFIYVYPILPLVHRPTFLRDFRANRHTGDANFFALVLALSASTIAHNPAKLVEYQTAPNPLRCQTQLEVVEYCHIRSVQSRNPRYFDEISHTKWAIAFMFYTAFFQVGDVNKARTLEVEAVLIARLLELHRISAYTGLNCIETQLRKKAFGFMMHAYVHYELQNVRKEKVAFIDCSTLHEIDLEELLPAPQDDEDITENDYGAYDAARPGLGAALRLRIELFLIAVTEITSKNRRGPKSVHCRCTRLIDPASYIKHLRSRLYELKYKLDGAPWYLRQWAPRELGMEVTREKEFQIGLIRADIHTTHLWLQTCILDHLEYLTPALGSPGPTLSSSPQEGLNLAAGSQWEQREEVCRQMLQVLSSTPQLYLETLGIYLIYKIRDVASPFLSCLDNNGENSTSADFHDRAKQYLQEFSEKLRQLDRSGRPQFESLQTWVDTDRN